MSEYNVQANQNVENSDQNKVVSLFQFVKELNKLKQKVVLNYTEYPWAKTVSSFPDDPENIVVSYRDRVENDEVATSTSVLLSVHKPEFDKCPEPAKIFASWLQPGWESFRNDAPFIEKKELKASEETAVDEEVEPQFEYFSDIPARVEEYNLWLDERKTWVDKQKITLQTRNLFADLYRLYFELQRESETEELIVANGILCDKQNPKIKHPVLTKRVKINYDPVANTVYIEEIESQAELYTIAFQTMDDINLSAVNQLQEDLQNNDYHPLDRNDTPAFLKVLVHQLSSESVFSESGIPEDWKRNSRLLLYMDPCYILRKRLDGTLKAIEQIIENVQETGYVPAPIRDIVSGGTVELPDDVEEESLEEQLAAVGGESVDVLLSKEANKEQLEIAKRIESYNAVLVQGPPGTGKTHTIANLLGHFLAQGKSVLVTSQTPKALSVLKEKVAPGLQNLCVSMLEDSSIDMERSIDGITDYMSRTTSHEVKREMERIAKERNQVIQELADVRRKLFQLINQESNCIVYNGEELSPSKAAEYVLAHAEELSYIPGKVKLNNPLPMTFSELADLYRSNESISLTDEEELDCDIPNPDDIIAPSEFSELRDAVLSAECRLQDLKNQSAWNCVYREHDQTIAISKGGSRFTIPCPNEDELKRLKDYALSFGKFEPWMMHAAVDGRNGGAFKNRWLLLIDQITKTCEFAEQVIAEQFGYNIHFECNDNPESIVAPMTKLRDIFAQKGKISKLALMLNKDCSIALESVLINCHQVQSAKECDIILHILELISLRKQCSLYWNDLLSKHGIPSFMELDAQYPEHIAQRWIPFIQTYLDWYQNAYAPLLERLESVGIPASTLFGESPLDSDVVATEKKLIAVSIDLPVICDICSCYITYREYSDITAYNIDLLQQGTRAESRTCQSVIDAILSGDVREFAEAHSELSRIYQKYALQKHRYDMLHILERIAPQWAEAIENREGIHGLPKLPETIEEAWKWKQLSGIIDDLTAQPFSDLQAKSIRLSHTYRKITAKYAEKCAWYHLLRKTEGNIDMRHALQGWKQTVKKIGKGTGRNAPALKAKARELMSQCQVAVPSWIMPINRALENLNPQKNSFDVIIIDEASQSDVSSLAILYMGKKLIIVGDDKQVSPMAVGVEIDKMNALQQMYIKDKIPNAHLYDAKTSIYDIAKTTFQPLMLREHFRCVPEIIGFSNMLSYDYKIKPLRDASNSVLLPAVVNYRVADGKRENNKTNRKEAETIVALMQACIAQPEYAGKTFGAISLLGDEQVRLLQQLIEEKIDHKELVERRILCGNASHFQGDERDVIFLSVVDSVTTDNPAPIRLQGFGVDDAYRKRYNVAASRARDQLWVVDSLDSATELKPGDIRKTLIDYSLNPNATELRNAEIEEKADSPFEVGVARVLADRGYRLVQQWKVGAYRLDMVAVCGNKTVAIECDGERYHSGESKVREDMERQTILERLGWRFIRIRGSEYFRNPEKTMERVIQELSNFDIEPDSDESSSENTANGSELLDRIKHHAARILSGTSAIESVDMDTIAAALDPKSIVPETHREQPLKIAVTKTPIAPVVETPVAVVAEPIIVPTAKKAVAPAPKPPIVPVAETTVPGSQSIDKQVSKKTTAPEKVTLKPKKEIRERASEQIPKGTKPVAAKEPVQMVISGMDTPSAGTDAVIDFLNKQKVPYVDKRSKNGSLWLIGGPELARIVKQCNSLGLKFAYTANGSKATKGKPGWYSKK